VGGLVTVLGLVLSASIIHGKWVAYVSIAIAVLTMIGQTVAVFKVPNTKANVQADEAALPTVLADAKSTIAQVQADLHAGAAQAAPWPTATPPTLAEPVN
ncbi:MAG: hypothetical protein KGL35_29730, partial [Bradyrhizobium sp.]|nr:hypothetical protein [Bradyrhizobium sp.]